MTCLGILDTLLLETPAKTPTLSLLNGNFNGLSHKPSASAPQGWSQRLLSQSPPLEPPAVWAPGPDALLDVLFTLSFQKTHFQ